MGESYKSFTIPNKKRNFGKIYKGGWVALSHLIVKADNMIIANNVSCVMELISILPFYITKQST